MVAQESVLVIDDNPETHRMLVDLVLEPNGYRHLAASDGAEGLRLALQERPNLVILDMQMPDMNGLDVLKAMRQQDLSIPTIVATVLESVDVAVQAFRAGACDYIIKPFDPHDMLEAIQRALVVSRSRVVQDQLTQQLVEANEKLQRQLQELNAIYTIGRSVTSLLDLDQVLNRVVEAAVYLAKAGEGLLLLLDRDSNELYLRAAKDVGEEVARNLRLRVDDSIAGRAIQSGRPVHVTGAETKVATGYLVQSLLYLPLRVPDRGVIGVLGVTNRHVQQSFSERNIYLLSALASYAAIAIENARLFEAVEVERAKLEAILREAQEVVIVTDEVDRVLLCNAAAHIALGLGDITLFGQPAWAAFSTRALREMFAEVKETGQPVRREVGMEDKRAFNAQLTPIEGVGHVLVMQDITYLKELDRVKSEFVATVSHDIRTPLTNILGYVELLARAGPLNKEQQGYIQRVRDSMESVTELIGDLLDMGRIEAGFDLEMTPCNLKQVIGAAVENNRLSAKEKRQDLHWEPPKTLSLVRGNMRVLGQAMDNLIGNAIKYTHEKGKISVSAEEEKGYIVVRVADNGIGIPPADQPRIFDRFFRVESEETAGVSGTGLGLAIVKTVIEKHNGRVWVESKPGEGSVFCFVLPALAPEEA
jgi:signal transduction histidine kinase/DNA-binding response OmpR family regulator